MAMELPIGKDFDELKNQVSRAEVVEYLCKRVLLEKGEIHNDQRCIPASVRRLDKDQLNGRVQVSRGTGPSVPIEPLTELFTLELTVDELPLLVPYLSHDSCFRPKPGEPVENMIPLPTSRFCFCLLMNSVLKNANSIREYDLEDDEWRDPANIILLIENTKNRLATQ